MKRFLTDWGRGLLFIVMLPIGMLWGALWLLFFLPFVIAIGMLLALLSWLHLTVVAVVLAIVYLGWRAAA